MASASTSAALFVATFLNTACSESEAVEVFSFGTFPRFFFGGSVIVQLTKLWVCLCCLVACSTLP